MLECKKRKFNKLVFLFILIFLFSTLYFFSSDCNAFENTVKQYASISNSYKINPILYQSGSNYSLGTSNVVTQMDHGFGELGSLNIEGDINSVSSGGNVRIGLTDGAKISFNYDGTLMDNSDLGKWHIRYDSGTNIDNYSLTGSIGDGAIIILKSRDNVNYEYAANPVTNIFFDNRNGIENLYQPSGEDLNYGTYYRVIICYNAGYRSKDNFFGEDEYVNIYCVQKYEFFLMNNNPQASFHNLSITEEDLTNDELDINLVKVGETLNDGSITTAGFEIDNLGLNNQFNVSKNDGDFIKAYNGEKFTETGKYNVQVVTRLADIKQYEFYVINEKDKGYNFYFGDNFINGKRTFREGDYPTYAKGTSINVLSVSDYLPKLYGKLINLDTKQTILELHGENKAYNNYLEPGLYEADFYSGNPNNVGSIYNYKFKFNVIDEEAIPYANYNNLINTERLMNLNVKHYEVSYQMTAGGYIFVCFSLDSYQDAFRYAYEIEKRFIEQSSDGYWIYKSKTNPQKKEKYLDGIELTSVVNFYAEKNIEVAYFNSLDICTYRTFENDFLENLELLNYKDSIRVFPSYEEKTKLTSEKIFINDFQFIQVGDYDVVSVTAFCENNGKTYDLEFKKPIEEQLHISSKYIITETNIFGGIKEYEVYYINENVTISKWVATTNGIETIIDISSRDAYCGEIEINADSVRLIDIYNKLDEHAIVTINASELYPYELICYNEEISNLTLYERGLYKLEFIDRTGNSYILNIRLNGDTWHNVSEIDSKSYTTLYNNVYIKDLDVRLNEISPNLEELSYTLNNIKTIEKAIYSADSLKKLDDKYIYVVDKLEKGLTQEEADYFNKELIELVNALVIRKNKQDLNEIIVYFESVDFTNIPYSLIEEYRSAYNNAIDVYNKIESSDEAIETAKARLISIDEQIKNSQKEVVIQEVKRFPIGLIVTIIIESIVLIGFFYLYFFD